MRLLEFDAKASLASVIEAIKAVPEKEVTLRLPSETPWLKNPVNEKILVKSVQQFGKTVHFDGRPTPTVDPIKAPDLETPEVPVTEEPAPVGPATRDEAGFVVGGDVMDHEAPAEPALPTVPVATASAISPQAALGAAELGVGRFKKVLGTLRRRWPLAIVGALALLLLLGAYVVLALPKADVKVLVEQRPLEREATLTASTQVSKVDVDARKIPAVSMSATESGTSKTTATGIKAVGTNAKGTVTIFNKTVSNKSFPAGTKIATTSAGTGMQFSFDAAVTVPAATVTDTGITFGQAPVSVTATAIGSEYNLGANTSFFIMGTPDTDANAKNTSPFSGGSKRDVQVVAQADLDKLLSDLTQQLSDKAKTDLTAQGGANDQIIDKALKTTVISKTYDKHVGDEATDVSLNLSLGVVATVYNGQDLKDILSQTLAAAAPDGYEVSPDGQETSAELINVEANGDLTFLGRIRANLIPKFDKDELARNLSGKKPQAAESYLQAIPSVVSYQVNIWPNLPDFFKSFPRDPKRIHIQVTVQ